MSNLPNGYGIAGVVLEPAQRRRRAGRRSRRGCAPPWPRRSRDGTSASRGRRVRRSPPEPAGREREQIGRQRLGLGKRERASSAAAPSPAVPRQRRAVAHRLPARGHGERERVARLQVRLVEAGKRQLRPRRDEQRVEELVVAVQRLVAGDEVHRQLVRRRPRADAIDDVAVDHRRTAPRGRRGARRAPRRAAARSRGRCARGAASTKRAITRPGHRLGPDRRHLQDEVVAQIAHRRRPLARQRFGDAGLGRRRRRGQQNRQHGRHHAVTIPHQPERPGARPG